VIGVAIGEVGATVVDDAATCVATDVGMPVEAGWVPTALGSAVGIGPVDLGLSQPDRTTSVAARKTINNVVMMERWVIMCLLGHSQRMMRSTGGQSKYILTQNLTSVKQACKIIEMAASDQHMRLSKY